MAEEQILDGGKPTPALKQFYLDIKDHVEVPDSYEKFESTLLKGDNLQKFYNDIKGTIEVPDNFSKFQSTLIGGTNPAEKKNVGALPAGSGSSGLLSVKFGGEDYKVNPKTQEVFKGGKPVTVPQHIKDYIAKNILGVGQPTQEVVDINAPLDNLTAVNTVEQPAVVQGQNKLKGYADVAPDATGMDIIGGVEKKLKSGEAVDVGGSIRFEKPEEKALVERVTNLDKFAKDNGVSRKQLTNIIRDTAAEQALPLPFQAVYEANKKLDEAISKGATPEEVKKFTEQRDKFVDETITKYDTDIKDLSDVIAKGKAFGQDVSKQQKELLDLKSEYNNFKKPVDQIVKSTVKANPSLTRLDKLLDGKTPQQKLQTYYDALATEYFELGRKIGYSPEDIKNGKVGTATFFGYGDILGDVSGEDRKRYVDLRGQLKALAPAVLINKAPRGKQDNFFDTFANSLVSQITPVGGMESATNQQTASIIQDFANKAQVELSDKASENLSKSLEKYGVGAWAGQTLGSTAGILAPAIIGGMGVGSAIEALGYSRYTAPLADFLVNTKAGKTIAGGLEYTAGGVVAPAASGELDFGSGAVGAIADMLAPKLKFLAPVLNKVFGKSADKAAKVIGSFVARGVGETGQETAQTLYQIYRDTPEGESVFDNIKQQFGDPSEALKFAISTFIMGGAMGGGADFGMHQANTEAYKNLSPQDKQIYDNVTSEQRAKANTDILDIAKEQAPKVPTENLQKQADNTAEAIDKLSSITPTDDQSYSIEVDGIKYEGNTQEDLQSDIQYLTDLNGIVNNELYNRNSGQTETPTSTEQVQQQPIAEEGVGVGESPINAANAPETAQNAQDNGQNVVTETTTENLPQGGEVKETITEKQGDETLKENTALKDVESTAKALDDRYWEDKRNGEVEQLQLIDLIPKEQIDNPNTNGFYRVSKMDDDWVSKQNKKTQEDISKAIDIFKSRNKQDVIAEAYHKAKADGSNPDLVKAVEDILAPTNNEILNELEPTDEELDAAYNHARSEEDKAKQDTAENYNTGEPLSAKENAIHEIFRNPSSESFKRWADVNHVKDFNKGKPAATTRLQFMLRKKGAEIDLMAQEASDKLGQEVTPQDVVDYILNRAENPAKFKYKSIQKAEDFGNLARENPQKFAEIAATAIDFNPDNDILKPETYDAMAGFPLEETDVELIKNYLDAIKDNAIEQEAFRADVKTVTDLRNSRRGSFEAGEGVGEKQPSTQKVNEQGNPISQSPKDVTGNGGENKNAAEKTEATDKEVDKVAEATGTKAKTIRDLYDINRKLFGQDRVKSLAAAVAMDRMIGVMAKRAGITKAEMYARLRFKKASETDLPQGVKMQVDAWHGSPYEFDKFTTEKIGTGEGAQAFGWGLYFTDLRGIAENYAKQLSALNSKILIDGKEQIMIPDHVLYIVKDILEANGGDIEKTIEAAKDRMEGYSEYLDFAQSKNSYNKFDKAIKYLEKNKEKVKLIADRNLYKVSLHEGKAPSDYTWLEWDKKPKKEQVNDLLSKLTQEQLDKGFYYGLAPDATNGTLYKNLVKALGGDKQASLFLLENGIDGVKYPAESISRGATSDTARGFNYVVFDENAVSVKDVIKFQKDANKARGAVMVTMDGNAVIYALTDPNVSTPLHEVAHVFEHYLTDSERATVNNWAKTGAWTTETSEKFARGFEKYLSEGIAPTEGLKKIFEKFKTWLTDIYNGIKGSDIDIELNDDMRSIYAKMLGEDAVPAKKGKPAKRVLPQDQIENLVKGGAKRKSALEKIAEPKVAEAAKMITDPKGIDKVMAVLNNDTGDYDALLTELEKKLGFKKIC